MSDDLPIEPTDAQIQDVLHDGRETPVVMINLNKYLDRDRYLQYGVVALAAVESVGGRVLWQSEVEQTVIGDQHATSTTRSSPSGTRAARPSSA